MTSENRAMVARLLAEATFATDGALTFARLLTRDECRALCWWVMAPLRFGRQR